MENFKASFPHPHSHYDDWFYISFLDISGPPLGGKLKDSDGQVFVQESVEGGTAQAVAGGCRYFWSGLFAQGFESLD